MGFARHTAETAAKTASQVATGDFKGAVGAIGDIAKTTVGSAIDTVKGAGKAVGQVATGDVKGAFKTATDTAGKVVQHNIDVVANGPLGPYMREELENLQGCKTNLLSDYTKINTRVTAWRDPVNNYGLQTTVLLHQACDYVHGIAVSYNEIANADSMNIESVRHIADSGVSTALLNLSIPGTFGGVPSILVTGVAGIKMVEGIANMAYGSFTLASQIDSTRQAVDKIEGYIRQQTQAERAMGDLKDYLLNIANNVLGVFRKTTGLPLASFEANSSAELSTTVDAMKTAVTQITNVKGNAFMVTRYLMNLVQKVDVDPGSDAHMAWIASHLFAIDDIKTAFGQEKAIELFVRQFFNGELLAPGVLLHIPPPPSDIQAYLKETAAAHETYTDPNSKQFDPPDIDLTDFPG